MTLGVRRLSHTTQEDSSHEITECDSLPYLRCAVFYYGVMPAVAARADVPVLVLRAGLDSPELNAGIEAFVREAIPADVPVTFVNYVEGQHAFDIFDDTD